MHRISWSCRSRQPVRLCGTWSVATWQSLNKVKASAAGPKAASFPWEEHTPPPGARPPFAEVRRGVGEERERRDAARGEPSAPLYRSGGRAAALRRGGGGTARVALARLPAVLV